MIYDGIINKPPMEEIIEHGWVKDAAAKVHKYLKRWKNKAGKWVYQYKKPKSKGTMKSTEYSRALLNYNLADNADAAYFINKKRKDDYGIYSVRQIDVARQNAKNRHTKRKMTNKIRTKTPMGASDSRYSGLKPYRYRQLSSTPKSQKDSLDLPWYVDQMNSNARERRKQRNRSAAERARKNRRAK